jgi:glucose-1-phosphate thymidylyltransferase
MKAIIPVAGAGTTLRPHTHTQPKALIPVAGKPILGHIIDTLRQAGVPEFVFVIGHLREKIQDYIRTHYSDLRHHFVVQEPRLGLAHAIYQCAPLFTDPAEDVVIALGDTIVDADIHDLVHRPGSRVCVQEVDRPGQFGIVAVDAADRILSLVEKPSIPKSNLAMVGFYKVTPVGQLMQAIHHLLDNQLQTNGEYQLTDALMHLVRGGAEIKIERVKNWYDCGEKDSLLETNRILLNRHRPHVDAARYPGSVIIPPVFAAESAIIENAIVGPFVALGDHAIVRNSIVENAILGDYSRLQGIMVRNSVVGNDTTLRGRWQSINIGDNTEIDFNQ